MFCNKLSVDAGVSTFTIKKSFDLELSTIIESGYTYVDVHFFLFQLHDFLHVGGTIIFA